jgi:hypothetical protein
MLISRTCVVAIAAIVALVVIVWPAVLLTIENM